MDALTYCRMHKGETNGRGVEEIFIHDHLSAFAESKADILLRFCLGTHWYLLVACPQKLTGHWLFMPVM